jgi:hypothetical protein
MMPYTQISSVDDQFPSTLCFGTQGGDPGGGKVGGKRPPKKKAGAKKKSTVRPGRSRSGGAAG